MSSKVQTSSVLRRAYEGELREGENAGLWRSLDKVVFSLLLLLIAGTAVPYGSVEPWWDALSQCVIFGLVLVWAAQGALAGKFQLSGKELMAPLVALAVFIFAQSLPLWYAGGDAGGWQALSADPHESRRLAYKALALTLALGLLLTYTTSHRRLRSLVRTVVAVGVASALFGLTQQALAYAGIVLLPSAPESSYGQFINRDHFAYLMEMGFGLTVGLLIAGGVRRRRTTIYVTAAAVMLLGLLASGSRGGFLSLICQMLFLALLFGFVEPPGQHGVESPRTRYTRVLGFLRSSMPARISLAALLLLTLLIGVVLVGGDAVEGQTRAVTSELSGEDETSETKPQRAEMWRASARLIREDPLLGAGFGAYWVAITEHHRAGGNYTVYQAHNDYLELAASGGIIAVALAAWFVLIVIFKTRERLMSANPFRRAVCLGSTAGLFAVAVHSFTGFGLHTTANALVFIALIVIAVANIADEQREDDERQSRAAIMA